MCVTEIFIDRYPDASESRFRQTRLCQFGRPSQPCDSHQTVTNMAREINYGEPTSEFLIAQIHTLRSSTSSPRPGPDLEEFKIDEEHFLPHERKPRGSFLMNAIFGDPPRRRRRRSKTEYVVVIDRPSPPSPSPSRSPPPSSSSCTPSPTPPPLALRFPDSYSHPSRPWVPSHGTESPPPRGRLRPIIVDHRPCTERTTSIEVNIASRRRRSESPTLSELHRDDEDAEAERRRERDRRADRLAAELQAAREQRERENRRAKLDDEIRARPAIPAATQRLRDTALTEQNERLHNTPGGILLNARRDRLRTEIVVERRRDAERRAAERQSLEEATRFVAIRRRAEQEAAQRERLRKRFNIESGGSGRARHRIAYDSGGFRYHN